MKYRKCKQCGGDITKDHIDVWSKWYCSMKCFKESKNG